jgi:hypothetical protein
MPHDEPIFQVITVANRLIDHSIRLLLAISGWALAINPTGRC